MNLFRKPRNGVTRRGKERRHDRRRRCISMEVRAARNFIAAKGYFGEISKHKIRRARRATGKPN